jgi:hypothetical protein
VYTGPDRDWTPNPILKERTVKMKSLVIWVTAALILCLLISPLSAQDEKKAKTPDALSNQLVGVWEIYQTKEPLKPYEQGYKGRAFVNKGPHAFSLILEYRQDGSFRRLSRIGPSETVQDGVWKLTCNELRQRMQGATSEEVLYVRFDNPDQFTSIEVYEDSADPGLFAQFRRVR